jgi:hypothetical protein
VAQRRPNDHTSRDWRDGLLGLSFGCGIEPSNRTAFGLYQALQVVGALEAWPPHGWQAWRSLTTGRYIAELAAVVIAQLAGFLGDGAELPSRTTRRSHTGPSPAPASCGVRQTLLGRPGIG